MACVMYILLRLSTKVESTICVMLCKYCSMTGSPSSDISDEMGEGRRAKKLGESSDDCRLRNHQNASDKQKFCIHLMSPPMRPE